MIRFALLAALCGVALPAAAGYRMGSDQTPVKSNQGPSSAAGLEKTRRIAFPPPGQKKEDPEKRVMADLSKRYGIPIEKLQYFRSVHFGYEDIVPALIVAREAQVEPGRILKMRMDQKQWKDIAAEFSVDLKPLNDEVLSVLKPIRQSLPKSVVSDHPRQPVP